jgi:DNA-binding MarR family transcriptional regulator
LGTFPDVQTDEDESVALAAELTLVMIRFRARLRREAPQAAERITWPQVSTLARIIEREPVTVADLAQAEHMRPQSMADQVSALRAEALIFSEPSATDGRKVLISSTPAGRRLIQLVQKQREQWITRVLATTLSAEERAQLKDALELMSRVAQAQLPPLEDGPG